MTDAPEPRLTWPLKRYVGLGCNQGLNGSSTVFNGGGLGYPGATGGLGTSCIELLGCESSTTVGSINNLRCRTMHHHNMPKPSQLRFSGLGWTAYAPNRNKILNPENPKPRKTLA